MGMRLMLHVTKAGEDPGNAVTRTGREEWDTPNTITVSNIETVNYSVLHASFVQTIIYDFYIKQEYNYDPLYSTVHPMKYFESDVMCIKKLYGL